MTRVPFDREEARGSQKWLQVLVNDRPEILDRVLAAAANGLVAGPVRWVSPLRDDGYSEYRDQDFLDRLDIRLPKRSLAEFWPANGPQWDALGIAADGARILVEAKAHVSEAASDCSARSAVSQAHIRKSLRETQRHFGTDPSCDWMNGYYQTANRLAHLYLLRELNGIPAWLVFLHVVGDQDVGRPATREDWDRVGKRVRRALGLIEPVPGVVDAYVDASELVAAAARGNGAA